MGEFAILMPNKLFKCETVTSVELMISVSPLKFSRKTSHP